MCTCSCCICVYVYTYVVELKVMAKRKHDVAESPTSYFVSPSLRKASMEWLAATRDSECGGRVGREPSQTRSSGAASEGTRRPASNNTACLNTAPSGGAESSACATAHGDAAASPDIMSIIRPGMSVDAVMAAVSGLTNEPDLAFTHYAGSMFITDRHYHQEPVRGTPQVVQLSRDGSPFFASVIGERVAQSFTGLEKALLDDPGNRGIANLFVESDLLKAALSLSHASRVAITTGFPCNTEYEQKQETDGLPGALAICQALQALGKEITLISDERERTLFKSCVANAISTGALTKQVTVLTVAQAKELYQTSTSKPPFDCLLATERSGRAGDGTYRTMKGVDVSQYVDPVDDIFVSARSNPLVATIAIGDGGNELGMGKVLEEVKKHIPRGDTIACVIPADFLIATGVSNWGGYGIALGLYLVSSCPFHWRYRNHGVNAETPPQLNLEDFLPSAAQTTSLLQHMNSLGVRDGVTKKLEPSVDGLSLDTNLLKLAQIKALVE